MLPLGLLVAGFPSPAYAAATTVTLTGPGTVAESAGTAAFTIAYTGAGATFSVDYATADGTAVAPDDYTATTGTANLTPGTKSVTVNVPIVDDSLDEAAETFDFTIALGASAPATVAIGGPATATTSITDNDPTPSVSVTNAPTVPEGDSGTTTLNFTVGLSAASGRTVTVDYATADGTATVGSDYAAANGTLTFAAGETSKPVAVTVNGDTLDEADETVLLNLSNPTNATVGSSGSGTIVDDDPSPNLSIADAGTITEGNSGTKTATFAVTLDAASGRTVTVDWATADGTATTAGSDYVAANGVLTFAAGVTSKDVTVTVNGDTTYENDETFTVVLSNPSNASVVDGTGQATIANDDTAPTVSIANAAPVTEGNSGTKNVTFAVTVTGATALPVTVDWATANGTATAPSDYVAANGTLTFTPGGPTTKNVTATINGDTLYEADETFTVGLSNASGATIGTATGTGTITNDDAAPTVSIADATPVTEGDSGTKTATFAVTLSAASAATVTVDWATADGTATVADGDYVAGSGTLNFAAGVTSKNVTVTIDGDTTYEADETFTVGLSNPSGASLGTATGTGTITNDDAAPTVSIADATPVTEGDAGTTTATFTVTLTGATALPVTVDWATADGTATTANADYVAANGTLTFPVGVTSKNVSVTVNGDTTYENDETFTVGLSNPSGATLATATGTGTIANDDALPKVSVANAAPVMEGDGGTTTSTLTVSLSRASAFPVTVDWTTADGTATVADADYVAANGTLTFPAGVTSKTVSVTVNGDTTYERKESLSVALSNPSGATLGASAATAAIANDDPAPSVAIANASVLEGDGGTTTLTFVLTLTGATELPAVVRYVTSDGTAVAGSDYAAAAGTVTFAVGDTSKTVSVTVFGDTIYEPNETLAVDLTAVSDVQLADAHATGTIKNDDPQPTSLT
ncbi:MAG: beta strand repeat-containing protein, partial [Planctomycetaceae bacterium]